MQVTKDITDLSAAAFLKEIGKKCPVTARLSTVVHERGCAIFFRSSVHILWQHNGTLCPQAEVLCQKIFMMRVPNKVATLCRSPESLRDVRGFSVKFYTEEGNWDFVGNDIPVRPFSEASMECPLSNVRLCLLNFWKTACKHALVPCMSVPSIFKALSRQGVAELRTHYVS